MYDANIESVIVPMLVRLIFLNNILKISSSQFNPLKLYHTAICICIYYSGFRIKELIEIDLHVDDN